VGVGAQRALPAAAAINWILKDGLGRLGRLSIAARFGNSFDSDLKARRRPAPRAAPRCAAVFSQAPRQSACCLCLGKRLQACSAAPAVSLAAPARL